MALQGFGHSCPPLTYLNGWGFCTCTCSHADTQELDILIHPKGKLDCKSVLLKAVVQLRGHVEEVAHCLLRLRLQDFRFYVGV